MTEEKKPTAAEVADFCLRCAEEKLGEEVLKINIGAKSSFADWFVIVTANSEPHLRALTGFIERSLRETFQLRPLSESGETSGGWILLDFGNVIIHLMTREAREKYHLEGLWGEKPAPEAIEKLTNPVKK